jgi:hypothetical protein
MLVQWEPDRGILEGSSMKLTLADYLYRFAWSQADLAREADVSAHCVQRALAGEKIARRNAQKIVNALDRKFQTQGPKGHITLASIHGLQIAESQRKRKGSTEDQAMERGRKTVDWIERIERLLLELRAVYEYNQEYLDRRTRHRITTDTDTIKTGHQQTLLDVLDLLEAIKTEKINEAKGEQL